MKVYGELVRAQLEILQSDPSAGIEGRIWFNDVTNAIKVDLDGTNIATLFNDRAHLVPASGETLFLGSSAVPFSILYLTTATIYGSATIAGTVTITGQTNVASVIPTNTSRDLGNTATPFANIYVGAVTAYQTGTFGQIIDSGLTATTVPYVNSAKQFTSSAVTPTELGYVSGVTSAIQTQLNAVSTSVTVNLGCSLSGGTFSICAADGTALSASNPAYVTIGASTLTNVKKVFKITANRTLKDRNTASDLTGACFGMTSGVAWGSDIPFYIYASNSDDSDGGVEFFIARLPHLRIVAGNGTNDIGYKGHPPASNTDQNCFFLTSASPSAAHQGKPCMRIGGITMAKSTTTDWDIRLGTTNYGEKGITDTPNIGVTFSMATAQNGASASSHLFSSGTVPTWASYLATNYQYTISLDGNIECCFTTTSSGNATNGSGGNALSLALPLTPAYTRLSGNECYMPVGRYKASGASPTVGALYLDLQASGAVGQLLIHDASTTIKDSNFSSAGDDLFAKFSYQVLAV